VTKAFEITDEVLDEAEECGALGLTMAQTAWNLGVNPSTLYKHKALEGKISESLARGRARGIKHMTNNLRSQSDSGSAHATIFYLKNRSPDEWANDMQSVAKIQVNLSRISDSELLGELREDPALLNAVNLKQIED
tara:strand:+ start:132 stop:539 length:408 start_codon:yes stop_codon:yes gene_type:complete